MTPEYVDHIHISGHAEDKSDELNIDESFIVGRLRNGHGFFFRDTEGEAGAYDFYMPDRNISMSVKVKLNFRGRGKTIRVATIFDITDDEALYRYHIDDRFEKFETSADRRE